MLNGKERVCVQGITGKYGQFHTGKMVEYGTNIVCGVSPNLRVSEVHGVKVFQDIRFAVEKMRVDTSVLFVPAKHVLYAANDAIDAGITKIIIITEHVPQLDTFTIVKKVEKFNDGKQLREKAIIIGPNCPGIIIPGVTKIGIMPEKAFKEGDIAIISRSGTLMYEVSKHLSMKSSGIKIAIGLGGDPIIGTNVTEAMAFILENKINKVAIIGEVGGIDEVEGVKEALNMGFKGTIECFFAGRSAPKGRKMGHAGAIISGFEESIEHKETALKDIGVKTVKTISELFIGSAK